LKAVFLKPLVFGLVHTEEIASFISDLPTMQPGMDRLQDLLTNVLAHFGRVDLKTFKRAVSSKSLWEEIAEIQRVRNRVVHRGEDASLNQAALAISVADALLNDILPKILNGLTLELDGDHKVCKRRPPKTA
jgi:hypothetical protein